MNPKEELIKELKEKQKHITGVRPPDPKLQKEAEKIYADFGKLRGGNLFFPYLSSGLGKGALVELIDGSVKYDMITGIGVHIFGHSHPEIVSASIDAALSNTVMQGNLQQNKEAYLLCKKLTEISGFDHCFLTTSGVMAVENALKVAFQHSYPKERILAFSHCFCGRTLTAAQITDKPAYRQGLPESAHVDYIPFYDPSRPEESIQETLDTLNDLINRYPCQHALMIMELIQGEGGGYTVGTKKFFDTLIKRLREEKITVIVDEVQTFGRVPDFFAFKYFDIQPDIVTIGKMSQVCATLYNADFNPKPGLLSQTFTASTSAIHASLKILDLFDPKRITEVHDRFVKHLQNIDVDGPFGIGGMIAFTPRCDAVELIRRLFDAGVISFAAGSNPTRVRFLPPTLAITDEDIDNVMEIVRQCL